MTAITSFRQFFSQYLAQSARLYIGPIDVDHFPASKLLAGLMLLACLPFYVLDSVVNGQSLAAASLGSFFIAVMWGISLISLSKAQWLSASAGVFIVALLVTVPVDVFAALSTMQQSPAAFLLRNMSALLQVWFFITFARLMVNMLRKTR